MQKTLQQRAVLMRLSAGLPGTSRKDKKVTSEVKSDKGLGEHSGKWVKDLFPEDALKPIKQLHIQARAYHDKVTFPFGVASEDNDGPAPIAGIGILPAGIVMEYQQTMREFAGKAAALAADFIAKGQDWVDWARKEHNGTFESSNYPGCDSDGLLDLELWREKMGKKFYLRTEPLPVPDAGQFEESMRALLGVDADAVDIRVRDASAEAQRELLKRMIDPVQHMASRLAGAACHCRDCKGAQARSVGFKDTLVSNIADIAALVPKLNMGGDAQLDAFAAEMTKLAAVKPDALRSDAETKAATMAAAEATLKRLIGYKL